MSYKIHYVNKNGVVGEKTLVGVAEMGMNFFSSEEDRKEFHRETIKHQESSIRFIEGVIKSNQDMIKSARACPLPGDKDILKMHKAQVKEFQEKLKVAKEKLIQDEMKYNERYPETIQERALKMGFAVIRGGALQ